MATTQVAVNLPTELHAWDAIAARAPGAHRLEGITRQLVGPPSRLLYLDSAEGMVYLVSAMDPRDPGKGWRVDALQPREAAEFAYQEVVSGVLRGLYRAEFEPKTGLAIIAESALIELAAIRKSEFSWNPGPDYVDRALVARINAARYEMAWLSMIRAEHLRELIDSQPGTKSRKISAIARAMRVPSQTVRDILAADQRRRAKFEAAWTPRWRLRPYR
jgi:hypothetical protein